MRREKDEDKLLSPMFPRVHVNDTEKGGPRAPPRNKMALYEQLTIPTQKFSSGSAFAAPLSSTNPTTSPSLSHFVGHKRSILSSPSKCSVQSHQVEKFQSHTSKGVVQSNEAKLLKTSLVATGSLSANPQRNPVEKNKISNPMNFSLNVAREKDDDFSVPASHQPKTGVHNLVVACETRANTAVTEFKDSEKKNPNRLFDANVRAYQEDFAEQSSEALKDKVGCTRVLGFENSSAMIRESRSVISPRDGDINVDNLDNCSRHDEFEKSSTLRSREVEQKDDVSKGSSVDLTTAPNMYPDVVVGLIGAKQFWRARNAIVNQQRIFAVQVFELHRLIKVQRHIAGSPHILLEDYLDKPLLSTLSAIKNKPTECARKPVPSATLKDYNQQPNLVLDNKCGNKNPLAKLPLPSFNEETNYELRVKDTLASAPISDPWCTNHLTPRNQWLVPVMSPSEGLIYKPYTGPRPPSAGFMTPIYGNYGSMSLNAGSGPRDFYAPAFAVPASHHQGFEYFPSTNQTYFPPYGIPVTNQSMSGSAPDQMSLFARVKSKEQEKQISTGDINYLTHQENSCEMPSQASHSMPIHARKFRESKGSELVGSTGSSNSERGKKMPPLFPTEPPAVEESAGRIIKVVPHHPKSATESAARIFQLIQEERNQL